MNRNDKKGVHSFQMDEVYVEALVEILVFTAQTAAYLAHKEKTAGRAGKELTKLVQLVSDSNEIIKLFKESVEIGEPTTDAIN